MRKQPGFALLAVCALVLSGGLLVADIAGVKSASAASSCDMSAASVWVPARMPPHRVEAFSHGPRCNEAAVMLTIRSPNGAVLWVDAMPAPRVMTFAGVKNAKNMRRALGEWLRQSAQFKNSADLPPWRHGASSPDHGEFPFYPEEGFDRDHYEKVRAYRVPVFCYVQGMESLACVVMMERGIEKIGVQSFPG